jgi:HEAT repeat protein
MSSPIQELIDLLESRNLSQHLAAKEQLIVLGEVVVDPLVEVVKSGTGKKCWIAAKILGNIGGDKAVNALLEALHSPNNLLRQTAVEMLGEMGNPKAVLPLIALLKDDVVPVRLWAAESLGRLGDLQALIPLRTLLHETESASVRTSVIRALGKLGDPSIIPDIQNYCTDENHHVRAEVTLTLARLNGNESNVTQE